MAQSKLMAYVDEKQNSALAPIDYAPGSKPLSKPNWEQYCRYRAQALSRTDSYRKANQRYRGGFSPRYSDLEAYKQGWELERKPVIRERIQYLTKEQVNGISDIRTLIAERLLAIHEADIGDAFETIEHNGKTIEKPKLLRDMSPDLRKSIEKVIPDSRGNYIPQLYSKTAASKELCEFYGIGRPSTADAGSRLSDAELVQQLADQAKELGVEIKLDYTFAQPKEPPDGAD